MDETLNQLDDRVKRAAEALRKLRRERAALAQENATLRSEIKRTPDLGAPTFPAELGRALRDLIVELRGSQSTTVSDNESPSHG